MTSKGLAVLRLSIEAFKDTLGPQGLVKSLLDCNPILWFTTPRISSKQQQRLSPMAGERDMADRISCESRINMELWDKLLPRWEAPHSPCGSGPHIEVAFVAVRRSLYHGVITRRPHHVEMVKSLKKQALKREFHSINLSLYNTCIYTPSDMLSSWMNKVEKKVP